MLTEIELQLKLNELQGQVTSQEEKNNHYLTGVQGPKLQFRCGYRKHRDFIKQAHFKSSGMRRIMPK